MPSPEIPDRHKIELAAQLLRTGAQVRLQVTGTSMLPAIWPGDTLVLESCNARDLSVGEIVFVLSDQRLMIHRLRRRPQAGADGEWITRGDCVPQDDPAISEEHVLGRVSEIRRYGRTLSPPRKLSLLARGLARMFSCSDLMRSVAMRLHSIRQNRGAKGELIYGFSEPQVPLNLR